jgi:hypothetical protein
MTRGRYRVAFCDSACQEVAAYAVSAIHPVEATKKATILFLAEHPSKNIQTHYPRPTQTLRELIKPCPACDAKTVELMNDGSKRFPFRVRCHKCQATTESTKTQGIAVKLWNEVKPPAASAASERRAALSMRRPRPPKPPGTMTPRTLS